MYYSPVPVLCYDVLCVCSTGDEVDEEYRANHEMELMLADLLPKADIAAVGLCEEEMSKPFVEDLHETAEERARLEAEKDEILRQLSKDVDFDLSRARKIGTIGDQTVYVEDCGIDFDVLLEARELEQQAKVYVKECVLDLRELLQPQDPEVNSKPKKTARDKFRACENCDTEIVDRILVCAGCKKVAYCNYRCQKAHWKQHKKTCSYALKKDNKERTG